VFCKRRSFEEHSRDEVQSTVDGKHETKDLYKSIVWDLPAGVFPVVNGTTRTKRCTVLRWIKQQAIKTSLESVSVEGRRVLEGTMRDC
jgi:hypothetical protein